MKIDDEVYETNLRYQSQQLAVGKEVGGRKVNFCLPCLLRERGGRYYARLSGRQRLINLSVGKSSLVLHEKLNGGCQ